MFKHYKKLLFLLIPACAGFCLALALGSADEPSELTQEEMNKDLVSRAIEVMKAGDIVSFWEIFRHRYGDLEYYVGSETQEGSGLGPAEFEEFDPNNPYEAHVEDLIAEGDKVAVHLIWSPRNPESPMVSLREMRIYQIADGKIVLVIHGKRLFNYQNGFLPWEHPLVKLDMNKDLVKDAILAFDAPYRTSLPEQYDPNYVQYGPHDTYPEVPKPHDLELVWDDDQMWVGKPVTFESIIAEGDMVAVRLSFHWRDYRDFDGTIVELHMYRIANGRIIEGWLSIQNHGIDPYIWW